jgi:hypothetical protein
MALNVTALNVTALNVTALILEKEIRNRYLIPNLV